MSPVSTADVLEQAAKIIEAGGLLSERVGGWTASWNDSIGQTQERVAEIMLQLAKDLRNETSA
jgi:hypothetical protein